jgi:hypothetical protein
MDKKYLYNYDCGVISNNELLLREKQGLSKQFISDYCRENNINCQEIYPVEYNPYNSQKFKNIDCNKIDKN